jgi:hypothetical protein
MGHNQGRPVKVEARNESRTKEYDCGSGRQERERRAAKPHGEKNQHVQIDEHCRMSKILKNG